MSQASQPSSETVKIMDLLHESAVLTELKATTKKGILEELLQPLVQRHVVKDAATALTVLLEREKLGSTGIGQGIAIPHAKTDEATGVVAALGLCRKGVAFDSLDGEPVHIVFLLLAPPGAAATHLKALARISRMLKDKFFRQSLRDAKAVEDLLKLVREEDRY